MNKLYKLNLKDIIEHARQAEEYGREIRHKSSPECREKDMENFYRGLIKDIIQYIYSSEVDVDDGK